MGLADRDYMRERHRNRQGFGSGGPIWKDGKARVELDGSVPRTSAIWIGKNGPWYEGKDRGFDYSKGHWRPGR